MEVQTIVNRLSQLQQRKTPEYFLSIKRNEDNAEILKQLLSLYEQAIEFYSAINDKRYIEYNNKISKLLKNPKYSELLG